jgi:hypothetical protein
MRSISAEAQPGLRMAATIVSASMTTLTCILKSHCIGYGHKWQCALATSPDGWIGNQATGSDASTSSISD